MFSQTRSIGLAIIGITLLAHLPSRGQLLSRQNPPDIRQTIKPKLEAIEKEIARRKESNPAEAEVLATDSQTVRDMLDGKARPAGEGPELHVVGMYGPKHWRTNELVEITQGDRPVVLVLCAYDPVRWEIKVADGAKLERVIVAGYYEQKLSWSDAARATPVETYICDNKDRDYFYATEKGTEEYQNAAATLKRLTGREITTFQGMSRGNGGPYIVGPNNKAWQSQVITEQLEPLYREATAPQRARQPIGAGAPVFKAVYFSADPPARQIGPNGREMPAMPMELQPGALADFTAEGPIEGTIIPLAGGGAWTQRVSDIAIDPRGPVVYGIGPHEVLKLDPVGAAPTVMKVQGDVPKLSWVSGIAFDATRHRLIVVDHGGEGHMVTFDPQKGTWTFITDMGNIDLSALTYSAKDDCFYGLSQERGGNDAKPRILQFDVQGKLQRTIVVNQPMPMRMDSIQSGQLAMVGEHLAMVTPLQRVDNRGTVREPGRIIVVDPKSGEVLSNKPVIPQVALAADFKPSETDRLWRSLGSDNAEQAKEAMKRLMAGGDKAVAALAARAKAMENPDVPKLVGLLDSEDVDTRERATSDLIQAGAEAVPQLRDAIAKQTTPEAHSRLQLVINDLAIVEPGDKLPIAQLRRSQRVANVLEKIGTTAAIEQLIELSVTSTDARQALRRL